MNISQKYPQILIGSLSSELALWFLEKLLLKYKLSNEKLYDKIVDKNQKLSDGLHIFNEKLHLETKYYSTDLEIAVTDYKIFRENSFENVQSQLSSVEGIIFLERNSGSHQGLYQEILSKINPSMQVIFRDLSDHQSAKPGEEEFDENSIFIETVYEKFDSVGSAFETSGGLMDKETDGIFRIFEIIETTMWSEMRRIKKEVPKIEERQENSETKKEEAKTEEKKGLPQNEHEKLEKTKKLNQDIENDEEMDEFANLIQEMKEVRDKASSMNDSERRKKAEEIMKKLMESCQGMDDDEEDEI